jgi:hypothetical protein
VRADRHLREQLLVGAAEDADPGVGTVGGEEKVARRVDQDAGDAGEIGQRTEVSPADAVDDGDAIRAGVRDIEPAVRRVDVCVVEARFLTGREGHEPDPPERHQPAAPASTSCRHQAYSAS